MIRRPHPLAQSGQHIPDRLALSEPRIRAPRSLPAKAESRIPAQWLTQSGQFLLRSQVCPIEPVVRIGGNLESRPRPTDLVLTAGQRSEEHTSELQSLMRISYAVFCLKKKKKKRYTNHNYQQNTQ